MTVSFVRQLGAEPGVQLNPLRDASGSPTADNSDQIFGIVMRATRGRIDKPFVVDRSNVYKKLEKGEQIRVNALNEAWVHVVEALNNGAYQAVVQRLMSTKAKIKYIVVKYTAPTTPQPTENVETYTETTPEFSFSVEEELPKTQYLFAIKHLDCFNDGIKVSFHVEDKTENGKDVPNSIVTLRISDPDGDKLAEYKESMDIEAKDDYGSPYYLPDVIASQTDSLEVSIGMGSTPFQFPVNSSAYGYTENGSQAWVESKTLIAFDEGGTEYETSDYLKCREALQFSSQNYAYISSGGTRSPALLYQLAQLAFDTNRQLRFDIPGELDPEAAVAFVEQLNLGANKCAHLMQAFWAPLKADDPTGINPKGYIGLGRSAFQKKLAKIKTPTVSRTTTSSSNRLKAAQEKTASLEDAIQEAKTRIESLQTEIKQFKDDTETINNSMKASVKQEPQKTEKDVIKEAIQKKTGASSKWMDDHFVIM